MPILPSVAEIVATIQKHAKGDMPSTCPTCGEAKRTTIRVGPVSDAAPLPVWHFRCPLCASEWSQDENEIVVEVIAE